MRAAPAVSAAVGLSTGWRCFQSLLWAGASGALGAWALARTGLNATHAIWPALAMGLLAWKCLPQSAMLLSWDGQQWCLRDKVVQVTVALDLHSWMLLNLQDLAAGTRRRHWLPVSAKLAGVHWHALRAALYSRAPEFPLAAAPPHGASQPD